MYADGAEYRAVGHSPQSRSGCGAQHARGQRTACGFSHRAGGLSADPGKIQSQRILLGSGPDEDSLARAGRPYGLRLRPVRQSDSDRAPVRRALALTYANAFVQAVQNVEIVQTVVTQNKGKS